MDVGLSSSEDSPNKECNSTKKKSKSAKLQIEVNILQGQIASLATINDNLRTQLAIANKDGSDEDFTVVTKRPRKRAPSIQSVSDNRSESVSETTINNSFAELTDVMDTGSVESPVIEKKLPLLKLAKAASPAKTNGDKQAAPKGSVKTAVATATKSKKPPPIVTYKLDHKDATCVFEQQLGHKKFFLKKLNKNCTHIITEKIEDYQHLRKLLQQSDIEFHTYTPKEERKSNIVLRNIDSSYAAEDITCGVNDLEIDVKIHKVSKFSTERSTRQNVDLNLWLIQLEPNSNEKELLATKFLLNQRVSFERMKQKNTSQCRNCQNFGHSAVNCARKYRCVKCLESHKPGACTVTITATVEGEEAKKAKCVNCKGDHPANYRGCKAYDAHIKSRQEKIKKVREMQELKKASYNNYRQTGVQYSSFLAPKVPQPTNVPQAQNQHGEPSNTMGEIGFFEAECQKNFNLSFGEMISKTIAFKNTYDKLKDGEKAYRLLDFLVNLTSASK